MQKTTPQADRGIGPETVARQVLDTGLTVLAYRNPATPAVTARLSSKAGALYDPAERAGLAGFTARAMRRGTLKRTFDELNESTEARGMSVGVDSGYHLIEIGGRALAEDAPVLLETIAEIAQFPAFPGPELERLRGQLLTGLREEEDDTRAMADSTFRRLAYPAGHPYSRRSDGTVESVSAITRDEIERHFLDNLRPDTSTLVIVGDLEPDEALRVAREAFGGWKAEGEPPLFEVPDAEPLAGSSEAHHYIAGKTQNDIVLGFPGIRRNNPDYHAMELMNLLLGRLGLYGRLGKSVREQQGLAYYAYSGFEAGFGPGPWAARAGVNPANVRRAIASILAEMERMQNEPAPAEEIDAGHRYLTGILPLRLETNEGVARALLEMELFGLGLDYVRRYPEIVARQGAAEVQSAAQRSLHPGRHALAIAGPEA